MNIRERSEKTKRLAICAMLSALGVVLLYVGSIIEVLDISMAALASLFVVFAVIEYGAAAWAIYAVTGILSAILLPHKLPAAMYLLFLGFYPIIKEKIEKLYNKAAQWGIKIAVFNVCLLVLIFLTNAVLSLEFRQIFVFEAVFIILANFTFIIYDIAMTRLISLYMFRLRKKFKFK